MEAFSLKPVARPPPTSLLKGPYVKYIRNIAGEGFTHETEKDKTGNVFLGVTKLGKTKLGI